MDILMILNILLVNEQYAQLKIKIMQKEELLNLLFLTVQKTDIF